MTECKDYREVVDVPAEFSFLVDCLRGRLANQGNRQGREVPAGLDWDAFIATAGRHRVIPASGKWLRDESRVPVRVRQALAERVRRNQVQTTLRISELGTLIKSLRERGVNALSLKGPVLSCQLYGDVAWRQAGDLDVLVSPEDIDVAEQVIRELGYARTNPNRSLSPVEVRRYRRRCPHCTYVHSKTRTTVELHWRLVSTPALLPLAFEQLHAGASLIVIGNYEFRALSGTDLTLHLHCHAAHHACERLSWLYDIAVMHRQVQDWPGFLAKARDAGLERVVVTCAAVCFAVLGTAVPPGIQPLLDKDRTVVWLVEESLARLIGYRQAKRAGRLRRLRFRWSLAESAWFRWGVLREEIFQTSRLPFAVSPGVMLPLHAVLRPFYWLRRGERVLDVAERRSAELSSLM